MIQEVAKTSWKEMYQVFNMGQRLEVYLPEDQAKRAIELAQSFNIDAQIIGHVEAAEKNTVEIQSEHGTFTYH
jgi:phosphoribosylformylglycinamidine cyclo-ligase